VVLRVDSGYALVWDETILVCPDPLVVVRILLRNSEERDDPDGGNPSFPPPLEVREKKVGCLEYILGILRTDRVNGHSSRR
jgi:hypothetical protein